MAGLEKRRESVRGTSSELKSPSDNQLWGTFAEVSHVVPLKIKRAGRNSSGHLVMEDGEKRLSRKKRTARYEFCL